MPLRNHRMPAPRLPQSRPLHRLQAYAPQGKARRNGPGRAGLAFPDGEIRPGGGGCMKWYFWACIVSGIGSIVVGNSAEPYFAGALVIGALMELNK